MLACPLASFSYRSYQPDWRLMVPYMASSSPRSFCDIFAALLRARNLRPYDCRHTAIYATTSRFSASCCGWMLRMDAFGSFDGFVEIYELHREPGNENETKNYKRSGTRRRRTVRPVGHPIPFSIHGPPGNLLGSSWVPPGSSWGTPGASWAAVGASRELPGVLLETPRGQGPILVQC